MDIIEDLLREILQKLTRIESQGSTNLQTRGLNRYDSLERYRVAYNRQNGFSDSTVHPTNPDAEDEID